MHSKTVTNAEQLLAVVERQALLEALLQAIADNLVIDDKSKMENFDSNNRSKLTIVSYNMFVISIKNGSVFLDDENF